MVEEIVKYLLILFGFDSEKYREGKDNLLACKIKF